MPHHSGGGSHIGGFHGGGFHGGGFHSSRNSNIYIDYRYRHSYFYFPGSRKYRYYDHIGNPHYLYSNYSPRGMSKSGLMGIIMLSILVMAGITLAVFNANTISHGPQKLEASYSIPSTYINDQEGWISNVEELDTTLYEFRELTGICPYILVINDAGRYPQERAQFAYQYYRDNFSDEQHFLIVIANELPSTLEMTEDEYVRVAWEAIQGDETDHIITEGHFETFGKSLQMDLSSFNADLGESLNENFRNSLSYMMEKEETVDADTDITYWICAVIGVGTICILLYSFWSYCIGRRKYELDMEDEDNTSEKTRER